MKYIVGLTGAEFPTKYLRTSSSIETGEQLHAALNEFIKNGKVEAITEAGAVSTSSRKLPDVPVCFLFFSEQDSLRLSPADLSPRDVDTIRRNQHTAFEYLALPVEEYKRRLEKEHAELVQALGAMLREKTQLWAGFDDNVERLKRTPLLHDKARTLAECLPIDKLQDDMVKAEHRLNQMSAKFEEMKDTTNRIVGMCDEELQCKLDDGVTATDRMQSITSRMQRVRRTIAEVHNLRRTIASATAKLNVYDQQVFLPLRMLSKLDTAYAEGMRAVRYRLAVFRALRRLHNEVTDISAGAVSDAQVKCSTFREEHGQNIPEDLIPGLKHLFSPWSWPRDVASETFEVAFEDDSEVELMTSEIIDEFRLSVVKREEELSDRLKHAEEKLAQSQAEVARLQEELATMPPAKEKSDTEAIAQAMQMQEMQDRLDEFERQRKQQRDTIKQLDEELMRVQGAAEQQKAELDTKKCELESLYAEKGDLTIKLTELQAVRDDAQYAAAAAADGSGETTPSSTPSRAAAGAPSPPRPITLVPPTDWDEAVRNEDVFLFAPVPGSPRRICAVFPFQAAAVTDSTAVVTLTFDDATQQKLGRKVAEAGSAMCRLVWVGKKAPGNVHYCTAAFV